MTRRTRLVAAAVAAAVVWSLAGPAYAATTPSTRPHPKGTPTPKRPHPKVNTGLPPGTRILRIETVPPVPGAVFTFQGARFPTDGTGLASLVITAHQRDVLAADRNTQLNVASSTVDVQPGVRAVFTGWYGAGSYSGGIDKQIATFQFEYLTGFRFVNRSNAQVTPTLLQSMQLQSNIGETVDLRTGDPIWLQGSQVLTGSHGLESRDIFYKITEVMVGGSNVVNSAQQRFFPSERQTATVRLLFYTVRFVATDAMFGGGVGKGVNLEYPDAKVRYIAFGTGHAVTVDDLPRGDYHVTVIGGGMRMARPVSISRDQQADLDVISYLDVGVVGAVLAAFALVVLWFGLQLRRRHRGYHPRALRREKRARKTAERVAAKTAATAAAAAPTVPFPEGDETTAVSTAGAAPSAAGDDAAAVEGGEAPEADDDPVETAPVEAANVEPGPVEAATVEPAEVSGDDPERAENERFLVDSRTQERR